MTPALRPPALRAASACLLALQMTAGEGLRDPGPRTEVAGISALVARSRLRFRSAPDQPHELIATFAFPERGRMWIAPEGASGRRLRFTYGRRAFALDPGWPASSELTGNEREETLRQLALRRAVLLWPEAFDWIEGEPQCRTADLGSIGSLTATLGPDGLPTEITSRDASEGTFERLIGIEWNPGPGRHWPKRFTLALGDTAVWDEEVLSVDPTARYVDAYFLPPDRRPDTTSGTRDERLQSVDVPAMTFRRVALPEGTDWKGALASAERARKETREELGADLDIDAFTTLELDPHGRPRAVLLRLGYGEREVPEGFERREEFPALSVRLGALADVGSAVLARLEATAGPGPHGTPYARVAPESRGGARVQLVLPLDRD